LDLGRNFKKSQKNEECYPFHISSYFQKRIWKKTFSRKKFLIYSIPKKRLASTADYHLFVFRKGLFFGQYYFTMRFLSLTLSSDLYSDYPFGAAKPLHSGDGSNQLDGIC